MGVSRIRKVAKERNGAKGINMDDKESDYKSGCNQICAFLTVFQCKTHRFKGDLVIGLP